MGVLGDPTDGICGACRCSGLHRVQTESEVMEQGRQLLQSYLRELLDTIGKSAPTCPPVIRAAFRQLFQRVGERFPQHQVRSKSSGGGWRNGVDLVLHRAMKNLWVPIPAVVQGQAVQGPEQLELVGCNQPTAGVWNWVGYEIHNPEAS